VFNTFSANSTCLFLLLSILILFFKLFYEPVWWNWPLWDELLLNWTGLSWVIDRFYITLSPHFWTESSRSHYFFVCFCFIHVHVNMDKHSQYMNIKQAKLTVNAQTLCLFVFVLFILDHFNFSNVHWNLTWTTGSLTCARDLFTCVCVFLHRVSHLQGFCRNCAAFDSREI